MSPSLPIGRSLATDAAEEAGAAQPTGYGSFHTYPTSRTSFGSVGSYQPINFGGGGSPAAPTGGYGSLYRSAGTKGDI